LVNYNGAESGLSLFIIPRQCRTPRHQADLESGIIFLEMQVRADAFRAMASVKRRIDAEIC
jgi:hypothetical protein